MSDNAYVTVVNNIGGQEIWDALTNSERAKYMFEYNMKLMTDRMKQESDKMKQESDKMKQESEERIKIINERMEKNKQESDERISRIEANSSSRLFSNVIGVSSFHGYSALSTHEQWVQKNNYFSYK